MSSSNSHHLPPSTSAGKHKWTHNEQNFVVHKIPIRPYPDGLADSTSYASRVHSECAFLIDEDLIPLLPTTVVSPVPSQPSWPFVVGDTPDRGTVMLASHDIPEGGLILIEHPVIITPGILHGLHSEGYEVLYEALGPDATVELLDMYNCMPSEECGIEEGIVRTNGTAIDLGFKNAQTGKVRMKDMEKWKGKSVEYGAVFLKLDRANHSCGPNAAHKWDTATLSSSLYALRPIKKGEEINIIYTDVAASREERRAHLYQNYRFTCQCPSCDLPSLEQVTRSDSARKDLREWRQTHPTFWKWSRDLCRDDYTVINSHLEALELIEQESLQGMQGIFIEEIALSYAILGDEEQFRIWAKRMVDLVSICDPQQAGEFAKWLDNPKSYKQWAWRKKQRTYTTPGRKARQQPSSPSTSPLLPLLQL